MRILVVEDEKTLADAVVELLRDESYAVDLAIDGETASELMDINTYDCVLLDWTIPGRSGMELLREWRQTGDETPVLMLTGRATVEDRVSGLDTGADDYLTKPFSLVELLARVRSLLRRRPKTLQSSLATSDVEMDRATRSVTVAGSPIELSPKEFALLEYLLNRIDQVVTRTDIIEHVWDDSFDSMSNLVDVTIYKVRKKIDGGRERKLLHTVKGVGYVLKSERS
ncbi:MAG: response regulator transcription factor [Acidobacteriota bacterium]|nr:response regulator transcription factor [Acidobacteriota bacterium]